MSRGVSRAKSCALVIHIRRVAHKWQGRTSRARKCCIFANLWAIDAAALSVCRHTLARGFGPGVGEASDAVSREQQTRPGTLFQRLSLEWVERGATSRVRHVCQLRTGCVCRVSRVYMVSGLRPSRQQTCDLRSLDVSDGGMAAFVGRNKRVCCLRRENAKVLNCRTRGGRRSDRHYCAASIGSATDATVQRLSPPFLLCGEAND
jgi:hypothetical protein